MLICLSCRRTEGDHALNCDYIAIYDHDSMARRFMDDNAELFESDRLTHPIGGGPRRVPIQSTSEFLTAVGVKSHLETYEHSMAVADDPFDQRMKDVMAKMNAIEAASLRTTRALMSWPEAES